MCEENVNVLEFVDPEGNNWKGEIEHDWVEEEKWIRIVKNGEELLDIPVGVFRGEEPMKTNGWIAFEDGNYYTIYEQNTPRLDLEAIIYDEFKQFVKEN